ncbi:MAG: hypothetical protein MZV70_03140 [Desulfobacterales bacterium]|nr:hypothetical protein [Desulfobacterales bacterium]
MAVAAELEKQTGGKVDCFSDKWNPNGGAIAFGHPNGASGARIGLFTMKELIRRRRQVRLLQLLLWRWLRRRDCDREFTVGNVLCQTKRRKN